LLTETSQTGAIRSAADAAAHPWRMLIGGQLSNASDGGTYASTDPATGDALGDVPDATPADVDAAVTAAQRAATAWRGVAPTERAARIRAFADAVEAHAGELAVLDALDSGNPVTAMESDLSMTATLMRMYADWALELKGETIPATNDHLHYTVREPYGVVARIVPYNHPTMFSAARSVAPIVAGNAVIVKSPDQTPISALRLGEIARTCLPPGLFSVISGVGASAGDALVRHPGVRRIAFIGSVPTGQAIQRSAAESGVKDVTLELGGKNPMIVFPDADLEKAIAGAVHGMNFHWTGGQSCGSTSRLLLHESLVDDVLPRVVELAEQVRIGLPLDRATEMGSMVTPAHRARVMAHIGRAREQGVRVLTGGGPPSDATLANGCFVAPTILDRVDASMDVAQNEIFGPVLSVITWRDEEELLGIANGVSYGLTASIWTRDVGRALRMARQVEAGFVWVNTSSRHFAGVPFGGVKDSGVGREEGLDELLSYTQSKSINVLLDR
jgi:acyl-CoA reductase-like NAD-dependent aldehyde dehydrogenase